MLQEVTYEFDALGRLAQQTGGCCQVTRYTYDNRDRVITVQNALDHTTTHEYDPSGDLLSTTDPNNNKTTFSYDLLHRLVKVTDAANGTASYSYDAVGNLLTISDPNSNLTTYSYDALNRLRMVTYADNTQETYTYDAMGNRLTKTDAKDGGTTRTYTYDSLNRLRKVHMTDGTPDQSFAYDPVGHRTRAATIVDGAAYTVDDSYDSLGRPIQESVGVANQTLVTKVMTYDKTANRLSLIVDAPLTGVTDLAIGYAYDAMNRITSIAGPGGLATNQYDQNGNLVRTELPNQIVVEREYDLANRLTKLRNARQPSGAALSFFEYTYDNMTNRTAIRDIMGTHQYTYDQLYRLTKAVEPGVGIQAFSYDPAGNRLTRSRTGQPAEAYAYNEVNELLNVKAGSAQTAYTYDQIGNLFSHSGNLMPKTDYGFDGLSRLKQVTVSSTTVSYGYDPDGKRVKQRTNGVDTWYAFDGLSVVMELDMSNKPTTVFTPGICKTRLDLVEPLTEFYLVDGLGSVVQLSDHVGNPTQEYLYDPFGATRNVKVDPFNRYRFVGLAQDDVTGLTYMNARWYDPVTGRFVSRDPIGRRLGSTQCLGQYAYASNNPTSRFDQSGMYDGPVSGMYTGPVTPEAQQGERMKREEEEKYRHEQGDPRTRDRVEADERSRNEAAQREKDMSPEERKKRDEGYAAQSKEWEAEAVRQNERLKMVGKIVVEEATIILGCHVACAYLVAPPAIETCAIACEISVTIARYAQKRSTAGSTSR